MLERAIRGGAHAFALTGSTAVDRRTHVSDLDYYVVGKRPPRPHSDEEIDVYAIEVKEFKRRLEAGDDYLHWTLRFGLILHDEGPLRWALMTVVRDQLWPDPSAKAIQARRAVELANAILATGDHDAAVEQCRVAFSLAARWWLLRSGDFPRARRDLPDQLRGSPLAWLGATLYRTIFEQPDMAELGATVERLQSVLSREVHLDTTGPPGAR